MLRYFCRTGRVCVSGVEVLSYRITLPQWEEWERVSVWYGRIAERVAVFCETTLKERGEAEYSASEDPSKRFRFPAFRYVLEGRVTEENVEKNILSVRLVAELKRRGDTSILERGVRAHTWSLPEEMLLPPEQVVALWMPAMRLPRKICREDCVLIDGGRVLFGSGDAWRELESSKNVEFKRKNRQIMEKENKKK